MPKPSAKALLNSILDRPIVTIGWESMPEDARRTWASEALAALNNRAIQHLIGKSDAIPNSTKTSGEVVKRCIEQIARRSKSHKETENIRMIINGVEVIRELLEEMLLPVIQETKNDLHSAL